MYPPFDLQNLLANFEKMRCVGSGSSLPYKTMIVLLAVGLGMVVNNDIERKGSFKGKPKSEESVNLTHIVIMSSVSMVERK